VAFRRQVSVIPPDPKSIRQPLPSCFFSETTCDGTAGHAQIFIVLEKVLEEVKDQIAFCCMFQCNLIGPCCIFFSFGWPICNCTPLMII
jgi:hypothetical protein